MVVKKQIMCAAVLAFVLAILRTGFADQVNFEQVARAVVQDIAAAQNTTVKQDDFESGFCFSKDQANTTTPAGKKGLLCDIFDFEQDEEGSHFDGVVISSPQASKIQPAVVTGNTSLEVSQQFCKANEENSCGALYNKLDRVNYELAHTMHWSNVTMPQTDEASFTLELPEARSHQDVWVGFSNASSSAVQLSGITQSQNSTRRGASCYKTEHTVQRFEKSFTGLLTANITGGILVSFADKVSIPGLSQTYPESGGEDNHVHYLPVAFLLEYAVKNLSAPSLAPFSLTKAIGQKDELLDQPVVFTTAVNFTGQFYALKSHGIEAEDTFCDGLGASTPDNHPVQSQKNATEFAGTPVKSAGKAPQNATEHNAVPRFASAPQAAAPYAAVPVGSPVNSASVGQNATITNSG